MLTIKNKTNHPIIITGSNKKGKKLVIKKEITLNDEDEKSFKTKYLKALVSNGSLLVVNGSIEVEDIEDDDKEVIVKTKKKNKKSKKIKEEKIEKDLDLDPEDE